MFPVFVIDRGSRRFPSAEELSAALNNGSTLLFVKENRPVVAISRPLSAPEFTEPSVPVSQEEVLSEPGRPHEGNTVDAEVSVRPLSTAEEACPEEKAMVKVEDTEEEASSSDHVLSPVSGSGSVTSSLTEGSSSVVDDEPPLSIQPVLSLPWIGEVVPIEDMKPPAPTKGFPVWKDLGDTVDPHVAHEETTPPSSTQAADTHQGDALSFVMSALTPADRAAAPPSPALSTAEEACKFRHFHL
nr:uncharacterized protein LOC129440504 [Misgurnus anguillicaudatus]